MKIEVDTIGDSIDEIKRTISILQEVLEKRTGVTAEGMKSPLRPSEFKHDEPKIIFEDILSTTPHKQKPEIKVPLKKSSIEKKDEVRKRKSLRHEDKLPEEEEEDEDRNLPLIPMKDYW